MGDIFINNLPTLDLHGYDRETARVAINDFINDNLHMKKPKILIIHGKGTGLVKKSVHDTLKSRKEVLEYHTDNMNDGCTIVYLMLDI